VSPVIERIRNIYGKDYVFEYEGEIGNHSVDFVCHELKIAIEVNGDATHLNPEYYKSGSFTIMKSDQAMRHAEDAWRQDEEKKKFIESQGYLYIVIWGSDFVTPEGGKDMSKVLKKIREVFGYIIEEKDKLQFVK
jgi:very-short-patch-repair endonuclease